MMQKISIDHLARTPFHLTKIAAVERYWKNGNVNRYPAGRDENIISYTVHGKKDIYDADDQRLYSLSAPAILLIAGGSPYASHTLLSDGDEEYGGHTICIRFAMLDDHGEQLYLAEPFRTWEDDRDGKLLHLFRSVLDAYLSPEPTPMLLRARLYELLTALCEARAERRLPDGHRKILPAIAYIEAHPAENTETAALAAMCYLSESYFRAQFRRSTGYSPTDFRNRLRISKAQELLDSSLWTVDMVAETLGFFDTSHFYRVYKKITGHTPRG